MDNWTKIITFTNPQKAYLAKSLLEDSEIAVVIKDDHTAQVNFFYSNAIGGVKLFVEETQVEEALSILKESGYIKDENISAESKLNAFSFEYKEKCPYCKSEDLIKKKIPGYIFVFSILLLGFPFPFLRKEYFCFECDKSWIIKKH